MARPGGRVGRGIFLMGMSRLERLLAGVAVVALITAAAPPAYAASDAVEAGVPVPAPADVSPPTIADFNGKTKAADPTPTGPAVVPASPEAAKPAVTTQA